MVNGKQFLVDAFPTIEQADAVVKWVVARRQEPEHDLCHPRPRRSSLWHRCSLRSLSDSPGIIEETRQYIQDFERFAGMTTARELYGKMLEIYRIEPIQGIVGLVARGQTVISPESRDNASLRMQKVK
jgi:hypothetical protein